MAIYKTINPKLMKGIVDSAAVGMDVTDERLRDIIEQFKQYPEASVVVVNFHQAELAIKLCRGSHVAPCIAIAYPPFCSLPTELKVFQAKYAVEELGAPHVLFTIDHAKFTDNRFDEVKNDIAAIVKVVNHRASVIVMPDFAHWTPDECVHLAEIIRDAGADLIKSTGGMGRAELPEKIAKVVQAVKGSIAVMGTSAIRNLDDVLNMLDAKPDKLAISRDGFFQTFEEVRALERVRLTKKELAHNVEGIIWHPRISETKVRQYLKEAKQADLYGVSVDPRWVPLATEVLTGNGTKVIARVSYPLGNTPTVPKVAEVEWVVKNGSPNLEIQTALNTSAFKSGHYDYVREELDALVKAANGRPLSVILQTPLLSQAEVAAACLMCIACSVSYIEPIHGFLKFSPDGSIITADKVNYLDVRLMKKIVGDKIGIKATGAVSHVIDALVLLSNGAKRITTPEAVSMLANYDTLVSRLEPYGK
jgi:deoxyribose-phosphate aldolase